MKALAGSNWGLTTETLVATYKAIVHPISADPIWFTQVSSSHLGKLEVIQNKALRIATGCHQKAAASHFRAETGILLLKVHLELCSQQFFASALQPLHPSHLIFTFPLDPRLLRATLQNSYYHILRGLQVRSDDPNALPLIFGGMLEEGPHPLVRRLLRGRMIEEIVRSQALNKVLMATRLQLTQQNNCCPGLTEAPSASSGPTVRRGSNATATLYSGSMTPPAAPPTTRWPISLTALHIPRTWPPGICGWYLSR